MPNRNPWFFIPPLFFAEGLVYVIVNSLSVVLYKRLGVSNEAIGITSLIYLPWILKMLWAPLLDRTGTKRRWVLITQVMIALSLALSALSLYSSHFLLLSLILFILAAFLSATHDIAADGFYMFALNEEQQSFFVGIRSLFYRLSMVFGSGALVYLAGRLEGVSGSVVTAWASVLFVCAAIYLVFAVYHGLMLPRPVSDAPVMRSDSREGSRYFTEVFRAYFSQKGVLPLIAFVVFYRFGEALLLKMVAPFLLDSPSVGGLSLATQEVGLVYGTVGLVCLMGGGIIGGLGIAKFGLKKTIFPYALSMNLPSLVYVYMAIFKPSLPLISVMIAVEQFCYGIGMTALTVVLIASSKGTYKTSNFAISTGIMAVGMMVPGLVSGWLQGLMGYSHFFFVAVLFSVPGMVLIRFLPKSLFGND